MSSWIDVIWATVSPVIGRSQQLSETKSTNARVTRDTIASRLRESQVNIDAAVEILAHSRDATHIKYILFHMSAWMEINESEKDNQIRHALRQTHIHYFLLRRALVH